LAEYLEKQGFEKPNLIESSGGAFEIRQDERLIFSKLSTGRFPEYREILELLAGLQ